MRKHRIRLAAPFVLCAAVLCAAALAGCAGPKNAGDANTATQPVTAPSGYTESAFTDNFDLDSIPETASEEDIQKYCLNCHLTSDEQTWKASQVTPALVDSMLFPTADPANDPQVEQAVDQSVANYFANRG